MEMEMEMERFSGRSENLLHADYFVEGQSAGFKRHVPNISFFPNICIPLICCSIH